MADGAMNELLAEVTRDERGVAEVILSKTTTQKNGPLKEVKFTDHSDAIRRQSNITPTCVEVRLKLNEEMYGKDVEIPKGHKIDVKETVITPRKDDIVIRIAKISDFKLYA